MLSPWIYLSFADADGWRGGAIVEAGDVVSGARLAHRLRINPGGQVIGGMIPVENLPPEKYRNRLLALADLREFWPDVKKIGDWQEEDGLTLDPEKAETLDEPDA